MKFNDSIKKMAISTFALVMLFGFGLTASANAQGRYEQDGYGRYENDRVRWTKDRTRQYAYLLGYHQSYSEGRDLREQGYRGNGKDTQGYRNDSNGFLAWMGFQNDYRSQYRRGYEEGFRDAQNLRARRYDRDDVERVLGGNLKEVYSNDRDYDDRDGRWGRGRDRDNRDGGYDRQDMYRIAQQNGYQDGLRSGQEDRRYNRRSDYRGANEYRNAANGYRREYGDRNLYQQTYRDSFRRGYEEGYRSTTGNSRWPRQF
jgi:hypothetical protein